MREKLIELFLAGMGFTDNKQLLIPTSELYHLADYLISNGVGIREKGEWIFPTVYLGIGLKETCHCSVCNEIPKDKSGKANFCPNCGADLRRKNDI